MALDSQIDELYKLPLAEFVAARNALAKTLLGPEAARVKSLIKPTVLAWSVNHLYWRRRDVYTRLLQAGAAVREAQLAALKGRASDVRGATAVHTQAVADAVKTASELAHTAGLGPDADALSRMFEAPSLRSTPAEPHGRMTTPVAPQGFEALAGVAIKPNSHASSDAAGMHAQPSRTPVQQLSSGESRERHRREREAANAARKYAAAVEAAEAHRSRATVTEAKAHAAWERAKQALEDAEQAVTNLKNRQQGRP